jgi:hypothetical protein
MNENPRHIATLAKYTKRPYIKEALLKNKDRTTKPVPKPQEDKAANNYQKEIGGFLIKQEKNNKTTEAIKTV